MSDKLRESGFLERWSARKRQIEHKVSDSPIPEEPVTPVPGVQTELANSARTSLTPGNPVVEPGDENQPDHLDANESAEALVLTDDDMPPIESLSSDSDLSGFFNKGVSAALRKAALRHVFHQPQYNVRDGLNDYDGDYTVFEPLGDTVTSDMKWHIARKERERLEAEARELEEQERLAQEQQAIESPESAVEELAEQELSEAAEDNTPAPLEQDDAAAEEFDESLTGDELSVLALVDEQALRPERVAGKLRRAQSSTLPTDKAPLRLEETANRNNAQDHEE